VLSELDGRKAVDVERRGRAGCEDATAPGRPAPFPVGERSIAAHFLTPNRRILCVWFESSIRSVASAWAYMRANVSASIYILIHKMSAFRNTDGRCIRFDLIVDIYNTTLVADELRASLREVHVRQHIPYVCRGRHSATRSARAAAVAQVRSTVSRVRLMTLNINGLRGKRQDLERYIVKKDERGIFNENTFMAPSLV
jgi:hypothetical protein